MRRLFSLFLIIAVASCAQPASKEHVKDKPDFSTEVVHPELKVITDEFFALSARNNIHFTNKVSIGFSDIDRGAVIGTCSYRSTFREIDIDKDFWKRSTWDSKVSLVYHEMTHCYCQRDHDFDDGEMYPDNSLKSMLQGFMARQPFSLMRPAGYLEDSCPKSVMHPIILSDECFLKHYQYYTTEMFARCEPF